ncbi:hypothetical protein L6452_08517 [Arctium lappa]|uniref:Uncharacterized protein n=1 Tax=Arctium lappa TaxID=4217 RepID=A0ACB9DIL7_ARCLA|nr:hypothetical protein L6452_08517 [Arctium lappa]
MYAPVLTPTASRILLHSLFLLFFFLLLNPIPFLHANDSVVNESMVPLIEPGKGEIIGLVLNDTRRKLGGFQICSLCTCCNTGGGGGGGKYCLPSPCCYAINCNIPNRPFGFCSFTPKTCNCFGCHL